MKPLTLAIFLLLFLAIPGLPLTHSSQADDGIYELRVYTCEPGKLEALHARFREHTLGLFAKHGMENVAYWTPTVAPLSENTLVYLLKHGSRDEAKASWDAFRNDPEWQAVAKASRETDGKILSQPPESTYLALTDYSPPIQLPLRDRVFELRTYTASEGNLDNLHARFRDHTDVLFQKHGLTPYGYWKPLDEPLSGNTMIYLIEHTSPEQAQANWKSFGGDPDWQSAKKASEVNGSLLVKGGVQSLYLRPTDYSPVK